MLQQALDIFLSTNEWQFTIRIIICLILGFFIGRERKRKWKNAGVSTFTLVLTWSMIFTYLWTLIGNQDPWRIAAWIVTGIWFLGAWLIIKEWTNVINLTTAAGIWVSWGIWMAIGMWYFWIGIISACVLMMSASWSDTFIKRVKKPVHHKEEAKN